MADRRNRRRRRRGRFGFFYKLFSAALILIALFVGCIVFFRVDEIIVEGESIYSDEEIIQAAGVSLDDNLFLIRQIQVGRSIVGQLPYISSVSLRLSLPNKLYIIVNAATAAAALEDGEGGWWAMDIDGKLLAQGDSEIAGGSPLVTGLTLLMPSAGEQAAVSVEESTKLSALLDVLAALEDWEVLDQVQSIDLSGSSQIQMEYQQRFTVLLPMYSDDVHLLVHTMKAAAEYLDEGQEGTIDLSGQVQSFIPAS
ncbi:MAG: FtsQ-type POTRA domain-containing protein [Oscillospiraceae bacterium]|nr:FtsQ-type POTRA domain-containing protein [Oscillospiraceae bacterium]